MKTLRVLVVISLLARCCSAFAEDLTPEKRADVEQLLQMTGAVSVGKQMGNAMVVQLTQTIKRVRPLGIHTSTVKKSDATICSQCRSRNSFQVVFRLRSGAGSIPCRFRILAIVLCANT